MAKKVGNKQFLSDDERNFLTVSDKRRETQQPIGQKTTGIAVWRMFLDYVDSEGTSGKGSSRKVHHVTIEGFNDFINSNGKWMNDDKYEKVIAKIERHIRARFYKYASSGDFTASFTKLYYDVYLNDGEEVEEDGGTVLNIVDDRAVIIKDDDNGGKYEEED